MSAAAESLGLVAIARDWNLDYHIDVRMDATAGMGIANRRGLGKLKHVHTVFLWVQGQIEMKRIRVTKKHTSIMNAEFLTKYIADVKVKVFLAEMGYEPRIGQHRLALRA